MNIFSRFYCRVYQTIFRVFLPMLPYREPKILNSLNEIITLLKDKNIKSVLLVTDGGIRKNGLTKELEQNLEKAQINISVYDKTNANPTVNNVEEARYVYFREI